MTRGAKATGRRDGLPRRSDGERRDCTQLQWHLPERGKGERVVRCPTIQSTWRKSQMARVAVGSPRGNALQCSSGVVERGRQVVCAGRWWYMCMERWWYMCVGGGPDWQQWYRRGAFEIQTVSRWGCGVGKVVGSLGWQVASWRAGICEGIDTEKQEAGQE